MLGVLSCIAKQRRAIWLLGIMLIGGTLWLTTSSRHFRLALRQNYRKSNDEFNATVYEVPAVVPLPSSLKKEAVMFLKTHKTGSSTVTNILNRYGNKHNLTFALPKFDVLFNWPKRLKTDFIVDSWKSPDILCNHARYSKRILHYLFPKRTSSYITILREPLSNFESIFNYMSLWKYLDIKGKDSMDILQKYLLSITNFKSAQLQRKDTLRLIRNPMLYDLGLDFRYYQDEKAVKKYIEFLAKEFDLVMIMEYFDESVVLLKRLMNWELDDVVFLKHNERQKKEKKQLSPLLAANIKSWNRADFILYEHFNKTFWSKIAAEGPDFHEDLANFRKRRKEVTEMCVNPKPVVTLIYSGKYALGHTLKNDIPNDKKAFCRNLVKTETNFYNENLRNQRKRISEINDPGEFKNEFDAANNWEKSQDFPHPLNRTIVKNR